MSALNFGSQPASAQYPAVMYPASSFFGAIGLQPAGANAANDSANAQATPLDKRHMVIAILVIIGLGYAIYHFNYKD